MVIDGRFDNALTWKWYLCRWYLSWYKGLVGYWHKYIAMDFGRELVLIFIRTSGMIVRYDNLEWALIHGISEGVLIQPVLILHVQSHLYMFNSVRLHYTKSQRPKKTFHMVFIRTFQNWYFWVKIIDLYKFKFVVYT